MPEVTRVKLNNGAIIRVQNEDIPALEEDQKKDAGKADASDLDAKISQLEELNKQKADLQAQIDKLSGELTAVKEQLEAATSDENVEKAAETINSEREDADKVMNSHGLKLTDEQRKLRGHGLRLAVVNSIRTARGVAVLPADSTDPFVQGFYGAMREAPAVKGAPVVPGAGVVNAAPTQASGPDLSTNTGRAAALYPHLVPAK